MMLGLLIVLSVLVTSSMAFTQGSSESASETTVAMVSPTVATPARQQIPKKVIGLRFNKGGWSDPQNDALWQGVSNALRETPSGAFEVVLLSETSPLVNDLDLVLSTNRQLEPTVNHYPHTQFVVLDVNNAPTTPSSTLQTVTFEEHEISYLLGYLAGTLSQTGQVGFVGSKTPEGLANGEAFAQGLLSACSECQLQRSVLDSDDDIPLGTNAAQTLVNKGVDIIFTDAGNSSQGVINYVNKTMCASASQTRPSPLTSALTLVAKNINYLSGCAGSYPLFFMGTGQYQPISGDNDNDVHSLNHGLASIAKRVDLAAYKVIQAFVKGEMLDTNHLTLKDQALDIAVDDYNHALLPDEVLAQLETIKAQIISGDIVVNGVLKE